MKIRFIVVIILIITGLFIWYKNSISEPVLEKSLSDQPQIAPRQSEIKETLPRDTLDPFSTEDGNPAGMNNPKDKLTFSNTMEWDPILMAALSRKQSFDIPWQSSIHIPPFPANSSVRTKKELELLKKYTKLRTPEVIAAIQIEIPNLEKAYFGEHTLEYYGNAQTLPKTAFLVRRLFSEILPIILTFKKDFDRVRPNIADPTLDTVIASPRHAAYPSGHSTQAHLMAYFLSELIPEKRAELEKDALRVAVHREIAGLHYTSDTAAGALLARQYLELLKKDSEFVKLLEEAKAEWN